MKRTSPSWVEGVPLLSQPCRFCGGPAPTRHYAYGFGGAWVCDACGEARGWAPMAGREVREVEKGATGDLFATEAA